MPTLPPSARSLRRALASGPERRLNPRSGRAAATPADAPPFALLIQHPAPGSPWFVHDRFWALDGARDELIGLRERRHGTSYEFATGLQIREGHALHWLGWVDRRGEARPAPKLPKKTPNGATDWLEAWDGVSARAPWMLEQCAGIDVRVLTLAAAACARLTLPYVPAGATAPREAIEAAERWATGKGPATALETAHEALREDERSYLVQRFYEPLERAAEAASARWRQSRRPSDNEEAGRLYGRYNSEKGAATNAYGAATRVLLVARARDAPEAARQAGQAAGYTSNALYGMGPYKSSQAADRFLAPIVRQWITVGQVMAAVAGRLGG